MLRDQTGRADSIKNINANCNKVPVYPNQIFNLIYYME